jgi:2-iminobutanoate/2-iminopropanoate deaminase
MAPDARREERAVAEFFDPPEVWAPFGAFSMGAVLGEGQVVHLKAQVALDREGRLVGEGDLRAQARQVFANIRAVLASVGGTMADVVSLTQCTTDIKGFMAAGDVRREFFAPLYPVTTTVQVAAFYRPEVMVEVAAVAEIPRERFRSLARAGGTAQRSSN